MKIDFNDAVQTILDGHREYHRDVYQILYLATNPAAYALHDSLSDQPVKHLSAKEYYNSLCKLALQEYGPLAYTVFCYWGLKTAQDVGKATYYLIDAGILNKQRHESVHDFDHLPSLEHMLTAPFEPQ